MKQLQTVLIALVALLGVAAAAEAVDLWTAPLFAVSNEAGICRIINVTTLTRPARIRIYDDSGTAVQDLTVSLAPFEQQNIVAGGPITFTCRFTVPSKTTVRAVGAILPVAAGTGDRTSIAAQ